MKLRKIFFLGLFTMPLLNVFAQKIIWQKNYGGDQSDYLRRIVPTPDYGFLVAGSSLSKIAGSNNGGLDYTLTKMNEDGDVEWEKSFGGHGNDMLSTVHLTMDGGMILGGDSNSGIGGLKSQDNIGFSDLWILKLNASGDVEWEKTFGGIGTEKLVSIMQTKDKGYIIGAVSDSEPVEINSKLVGHKSEKSFGGFDFWIVKINSSGDVEWEKTIGGNGYDYLVNCFETNLGHFLIGGYSNSPLSGNKSVKLKGEGDYLLVELDKNGTIIDERNFGGKGNNELTSFSKSNGGYIFGGRSNSKKSEDKSTDSKDYDFWIVKTDELGKILWDRTFDIGKFDVLLNAIEDKNGDIVVSGYAQTESQDNVEDKDKINNYSLIYLDNKGNEKLRKDIGGSKTDILNNTILTRDQSIIMAGTSNSNKGGDKTINSNGRNDFWILKIGNPIINSSEERHKIEIYPNPTERFVNVISDNELKGSDINVISVGGQLLQNFQIKSTTAVIDLAGYPQGIYLISIISDSGVITKKILKTGAK